ncbi:hypothetical protein VST7929_01094 [Vibrio stylophorae]|uniref:Uncharacterized protein n=1 Tax=Vibrio stylophorae TaxID=659351 RepID=A0ABM8ZSE7_9VIBR|nr:hypothetical protein [Vibrio stylophorae]CAH0533230.1 hypothetical protein VST7929_01094 [Vibrio stylophorae]
MSIRGLSLLLILVSHFSHAATLTTKHYIVSITSNCMEGEVTCNDVTYTGQSKKTGDKITLKGRTLHTYLSNGTPSQFLGYQFTHGNVTYRVSESGVLTVTQGEKVLLSEQGKWEW